MTEPGPKTAYTGLRAPCTFRADRNTRIVTLEIKVAQLIPEDDPDMLVDGEPVSAREGEFHYILQDLKRAVLYARGDVETMAEAWERIPHP